MSLTLLTTLFLYFCGAAMALSILEYFVVWWKIPGIGGFDLKWGVWSTTIDDTCVSSRRTMAAFVVVLSATLGATTLVAFLFVCLAVAAKWKTATLLAIVLVILSCCNLAWAIVMLGVGAGYKNCVGNNSSLWTGYWTMVAITGILGIMLLLAALMLGLAIRERNKTSILYVNQVPPAMFAAAPLPPPASPAWVGPPVSTYHTPYPYSPTAMPLQTGPSVFV